MKTIKDAAAFAKGILLSPETQLLKLAGGTIAPIVPLSIYIACALANAFFLSVRPPDFPVEFARLGLQEKSAAFYFLTELCWGTVFIAASCALLMHLAKFFSAGKTFLRVLCSSGVILTCAAATFRARHAPAAMLSLAVCATIFLVVVIRREKQAYRDFFLTALALSLVGAVVLPVEFAAVYLRSENLFIAAELAAGLWTLLLLVKATVIFTGASVPKTMLALISAFLAAMLFLSILHGAGVISKDAYELMFIL